MSPEDEALMARAREQRGWTADRVAALKVLYDAGQSFGQIAKRLGGMSRHMAQGKTNRMGFVTRKPPSAPTTNPIPMKPPKPKAITKPNGVILKPDGMGRIGPALEPLPIPSASAVPATARHWITRKSGECAWPVGEARGYDQWSCCAPVSEPHDPDCRYCKDHARIAFQPQQKGKRHGATELARSLRRYL